MPANYKAEFKIPMIREIARVLKEISHSWTLNFWDMILEQTRYFAGNEQRVSILEFTAEGLLNLKIPLNELIWKKYWSICDLLKDMGTEHRDNILSLLAVKFAEQGFFSKASEIISRLSAPAYRAAPLAALAIRQIEEEGIDHALLTIEEISEVEEAYRVFAEIAP